jgi:catechol 2,3-dioxygenase-like lactoylglutathione lyase family enzyme
MNVTFSMFELVVADMPTTLAFYRRLGFDIPESADTEMHVDVAIPGGLHLVFDTEAVLSQVDPSWIKPSGGHRAALAFACASPADVDAAYAELTGAGYEGHLAPWDAFWGMRYAVVHDPDGTPVDLFAELPVLKDA